MIKVYTAVGNVALKKRAGLRHPLVIYKNQEMELSVTEMMIWTILTSAIYTYEEIQQNFDLRQVQLQLRFSDFDSTLKCLIQRGLVATGEGEQGMDALHQLLSPLQLTSEGVSFHKCFGEFMRLVMLNHMPISMAVRVFQKLNISENERYILKLLKGKKLGFTELLEKADSRFEQPYVLAILTNLYCCGLIRIH